MSITTRSAVVPALLAIAFLGAGCKNPLTAAKEKMTESVVSGVTGGKVKMDSEDGGATFTDPKTGAKMAVGDDLKIPDDFPKDVPIYAGSKVKAVVMADETEKNATISLASADAPKTVAAWYEKTLEGAGWKQSSTYNANGSFIFVYEKDNTKIAVTVALDSQTQGSSITVIRSEEKE